MADHTPTTSSDDDIRDVAALLHSATLHANRAAGQDLFSPWLDVLAETVTAAGYLADVPPAEPRTPPPRSDGGGEGARALLDLHEAARILDAATGPRVYRAILVRAAITQAIAIADRATR